MIDVGPIAPWDMFKSLCKGTAVAKFKNILLKASGKTFEFIEEYFNKKICLAYKNSEKFKSWKGKNYK